jgi:hypothetical protein
MLGEGLLEAYQGKLDAAMEAALKKTSIKSVVVDPETKHDVPLRLTSCGVKAYGDMLTWWTTADVAIDGFVKEFLGYLVKVRMFESVSPTRVVWKMAPRMVYSCDGWAAVSWIQGTGHPFYGGIVSGEHIPLKPGTVLQQKAGWGVGIPKR